MVAKRYSLNHLFFFPGLQIYLFIYLFIYCKLSDLC